jgi:hypothetical protein
MSMGSMKLKRGTKGGENKIWSMIQCKKQDLTPCQTWNACNKALVARMIGNALPPPFIAAHARAVYRKLLNPGD